MALYELNPGSDRDADAFDAVHPWGLPGVRCLTCGEWSTTGLSYPNIDFSASSLGPLLSEARLAELEEYRSLEKQVDRVTGGALYLKPGAEFGPLIGEVLGRVGEVAWANPWTMLISASIARALSDLGFALPSLVPCQLDGLDGRDLFEPAISVVEVLGGSPGCGSCGRHAPSKDQIVEALALRQFEQPLFRIAEFSTMICCSREFADAITSLSSDVGARLL